MEGYEKEGKGPKEKKANISVRKRREEQMETRIGAKTSYKKRVEKAKRTAVWKLRYQILSPLVCIGSRVPYLVK